MSHQQLDRLIRCARGDAPVDLLLSGGQIVDVLTGEIRSGDVGIVDGRFVGVGAYEAQEAVELDGSFVAPGLIDAHVHIESSMVTPAEFSRVVVPFGTTTVVTDPHEIANVLGLAGIRFMLDNARGASLSMFVMASSCVPATHMETSGAQLDAEDLVSLLEQPSVLGLAEVMNFPGVVAGADDMLAKIRAFAGTVLDGHCPGLSGQGLNAYAAAGISSDHECTTLDEALEKLRAGLTLFIREATNARNLHDLLPVVDERNHQQICLCTDDRTPAHLLDEGHVDGMVREAIASGLDPVVALRMATSNTARYFRLADRGAIAPGRRADAIVFDEIEAPKPRLVLCAGRVAARDGVMVGNEVSPAASDLPPTVRVDWDAVDLSIPASGSRCRVIGAIPDQLITEHLEDAPRIEDGMALADPSRDLLKMAVVERHGKGGTVGLGFVRGVGLRSGALASSVAHDHHNIVVIGADDDSMMTAARAVAASDGGLAVASGGNVLARVPLPIAGLMSDRPAAEVRKQLDTAIDEAKALGSRLEDPFMAMSFLALEVIPSLKLTDLGLVDVERFEIVPLWVS